MTTVAAIETNGRRPSGAKLLGRVEPAFRDLIKEALDQGALLRAGTGKHPMKVICPDGETLTLSQTSSDWRARKNAQAFLRRHGLEVGPKSRRKQPKRPDWVPGNARRAHERAEAWLAMQAEDREFTVHDFATELGLATGDAASATKARYLAAWLTSGKVHFVRYHHNPGQRGIGTQIFARRPPLRTMDDVIHALTPTAEAKADEAIDRLLGPAPEKPPSEVLREIEVIGAEPNGATAAEMAATAPEASPRAQMWRHVSDALFSLAQAAELAARLEGV